MNDKPLKVRDETTTGENTSYLNTITGDIISKEDVIAEIEKGSALSDGYHVVQPKTGTPYVRSNPDQSTKNNIE